MAGSYVNNGDGTVTVSFAYTALIEKAQKAIELVAKKQYEHYPVWATPDDIVPFGDLTNQQKLDIVDQFIKDRLMLIARNMLVSDAISTATDSAYQDDTIDLQ